MKNGDVNFVSPSIVFNNGSEVADKDGNSIITEFEGAHVAGVAEPAYGIDKAEIKGKCVGSKESCNITLEKVEASVSECGNYLRIKRTKSAGKKKTQKELDEDYEVQMQSFSKEGHHWGQPHKHPHEVTERGGVTEEEYKKYTSNKGKKGKEINNMKKSQEEKKKDEADETPEEDEVKRGESLDEQYKDKEETDIMKSEEEKDEEDAEEEDDEKDAEEEYLKDKKESSLRKQVRTLKAELRAVKAKIRSAEIDPIIQGILDAKKLVGKVDAKAEYRRLAKLDIGTLRELEAHYDTIKEAKSQPRYVVRNASVNSSDKTGDNLLLSMRGDF